MKKSLAMGGKIGAQNFKSQGVSSRLAHPAGRLSDSWRRLLAKLSGQPTPGSVPSPSRAQSLSRADRRSLRAFAFAALACAALMGFSATAQAQTDVLSATLTVKDLGTSQVGCANTTPSARCSDFLSEDEFTYDSTDYAVTDLFVRPSGALVLGFNADLTTAAQTLTLDVAGTTFAFEDAETKTTAVRIWSNSGLSWSVDDPVVVKLVEPAPTVPGAPVLTATANGQTQIDLSWTVPDTGGRSSRQVLDRRIRRRRHDLVAAGRHQRDHHHVLPHRPHGRDHAALPGRGGQPHRHRRVVECRQRHHGHRRWRTPPRRATLLS